MNADLFLGEEPTQENIKHEIVNEIIEILVTSIKIKYKNIKSEFDRSQERSRIKLWFTEIKYFVNVVNNIFDKFNNEDLSKYPNALASYKLKLLKVIVSNVMSYEFKGKTYGYFHLQAGNSYLNLTHRILFALGVYTFDQLISTEKICWIENYRRIVDNKKYRLFKKHPMCYNSLSKIILTDGLINLDDLQNLPSPERLICMFKVNVITNGRIPESNEMFRNKIYLIESYKTRSIFENAHSATANIINERNEIRCDDIYNPDFWLSIPLDKVMENVTDELLQHEVKRRKTQFYKKKIKIKTPKKKKHHHAIASKI